MYNFSCRNNCRKPLFNTLHTEISEVMLTGMLMFVTVKFTYAWRVPLCNNFCDW